MLVNGYLDRKAGAGDAVGKGRWSGGGSFEKSSNLFVEPPGKRAFLSTIPTDISCTPPFYEALCLGVFVPGVFRVPIEEIVMDGELRNIVHVALGNLFACFVYADGRVMYLRRRS